MSAPSKVRELVDRFHRNADAYHAPQYNEAMVRQEFINPLFKSLGWDMDNEQGYAEAYKDVIHEDLINHFFTIYTFIDENIGYFDLDYF